MWRFHVAAADGCGSPSGTDHGQKRRRSCWIWTERALLVSGLVLLAGHGAARVDRILSSRAALKQFADLESSTPAASRRDGRDTKNQQRGRANNGRVSEPQGAALGVLRIPKIRLEVPLLDGTTDRTLNHAVGRIAGTARPGEQGNLGIAGHRDGFFRGLKDVTVGDAIELRTWHRTDTYVVDHLQIVTPADVWVLERRSRPSLTLVTCYPFYFIGSAPQRYIVTASLTRETGRI
jgi:sortase A